MTPTDRIKQNLERANAEALRKQEQDQLAAERAQKAAAERREHAFQIKLTLFSNALSFILGILATLIVQHLLG